MTLIHIKFILSYIIPKLIRKKHQNVKINKIHYKLNQYDDLAEKLPFFLVFINTVAQNIREYLLY